VTGSARRQPTSLAELERFDGIVDRGGLRDTTAFAPVLLHQLFAVIALGQIGIVDATHQADVVVVVTASSAKRIVVVKLQSSPFGAALTLLTYETALLGVSLAYGTPHRRRNVERLAPVIEPPTTSDASPSDSWGERRAFEKASLRGLGERTVDRGLEVIERSGASNKADPLDFAGIIGIGLGQDEARGSGRPSFLRLGHVPADGRGVLLGAHAQLESGLIEPDRLGVSDPGLELTLVSEQPGVHFPVLALLLGTVRSLGRLERESVDRLER